MSIKVMNAVFDRYPNGGGEMLLALALADHASDDGARVFPKIKALAEKTRQSERSVQYQLRAMQESGWLIQVSAGNGGRSMSTEYRISQDWIKGAEIAPIRKGANDDAKGATGDVKGCNLERKRVQPIAPANNRQEPSKNHQESSEPACAEKHKTSAVRACQLPDEFTPDLTAQSFAAQSRLDIAAELEAFSDHHRAKGSTFKDWQAAFRTWLRNAVKFSRPSGSGQRHTGNKHAGAAAAIWGAPQQQFGEVIDA